MPPVLKKGDCIGVAASASHFDKELFQKGIACLKNLGFEVYYRDDIFAKESYLAGSDQRRTEELTELFLNPQIKAIFFARGGYGSQRILPLLDIKEIQKHPKPVVGFSDTTPLLNFLYREAGIPALYGPVITQLGNHPAPETLETLLHHLTKSSPPPPLALKKCKTLQKGTVTAPIVGGCLSLITSSIGTPFEIKADGALLFFEDTNEKLYTLDRMLTHLQNAGKLDRVKGILIGDLGLREEEEGLEEMLKERLAKVAGPVVAGFPSGHVRNFISLPLGISATLDTTRGELKFNEPFLLK